MVSYDGLTMLVQEVALSICSEPFYAVVFWAGGLASAAWGCRSYLCETKFSLGMRSGVSSPGMCLPERKEGSPAFGLPLLHFKYPSCFSIRMAGVTPLLIAKSLPPDKESR